MIIFGKIIKNAEKIYFVSVNLLSYNVISGGILYPGASADCFKA